jgi:hypothetical protein
LSSSSIAYCEILELLKIDKLQCGHMGRFKMHTRSPTGFQRLFPPLHAEAPAVTGFQPREMILRHRRTEVVSDSTRKLKKFGIRLDADQVQAKVLDTRITATVSIETRDWIKRAWFEGRAKNIFGRLSLHC